jgi:glycosyltransferase involved in cell wall biosynthesis
MMTFSFVIPTYNHYNLLHQTLFDIYQKCSPVHEVIVVDDCSTDLDYHSGLRWWKESSMLPIRVVKMKENSMFLKASNAGLKKATGDIVCLLSNDVRLRGDIVKSITGILDELPNTLIG